MIVKAFKGYTKEFGFERQTSLDIDIDGKDHLVFMSLLIVLKMLHLAEI